MAKLRFAWIVARPDSREFRMNSTELVPQRIQIEVDVADECVIVDDDVSVIGVDTMRYALRQLESVFLDKSSTSKPAVEDDTEGWGETETKTNKKSAPASDDEDEGWGETESDSETKPESKTDSEDDVPWNDNEEEWEK